MLELIVIGIVIGIYVLFTHYRDTGTDKNDKKEDSNECTKSYTGAAFKSDNTDMQTWINNISGEGDTPVDSPSCYKESKCGDIMNKFSDKWKTSYIDVLDKVVTKNDTEGVNVVKYNCSKCLQGSDDDPVIKKLSNLSYKDSEFAMKVCDAMRTKCGNPTFYAIRNINWDNECRSGLSNADTILCNILQNSLFQFFLNIIPDSCSLKIMGSRFLHNTKCTGPQSALFDECK